jgi:hypothetical protein
MFAFLFSFLDEQNDAYQSSYSAPFVFSTNYGLCLQFSVTPSICIFYELLQVMSRFFHECVCYNCKSFGNYANILTSYLLPILFPITPLLKGLLDGKATQTQLIEYALALARLRCA